MNRLRRGLLDEITATALEPGYRRGSRPSPWRTAAVLLVIGLLLGLAGVQTHLTRDARAQERDALVAQARRAQAQHDALVARQDRLQADIARERDAALGQGAEADATRARLEALQVATGTSQVRGGGVVVTLTDAPDATTARGRVLDVDLRQVVNGLWQAGAEAVAVNGRRLTPTTAIRSAGEAITVNYRSLAAPYRVEAVGDPKVLPARFAATPGGQYLAFLRANYGVQTATAAASDLVLPAAEPALRHATRKEG